ncbi:(2Fe-2S)-binding protein [Flammeovirga yaeyamensis]|nr:2Fe-2S iron-sulfur cluster-binding protein [Flammeovirga yaeyamensis]
MMEFSLKVNKKNYTVDVEAGTPLLWVLRDELQLMGTKYGCGVGQCGACTVHLDGEAQKSCQTMVELAEGVEITTIEGLSEKGDHPVQEAWKEIDVPQCGYCQGGQIMKASAFLAKNPSPNKDEIRMAMQTNICRCASYNRIEKAVAVAAEKLTK